MSVKSVYYARNRATADDTTENWSDAIWHRCPWEAILDGQVRGFAFVDHFTAFPKTPPTTEGNWGQYAAFTDTGGTMTAGTGQGGELVIGSDGDNEGASIRTLATPFKLIQTGYDFWFECRVKSSTIADNKHGFFVGLMQDVALTATVPITAAGAIADTNLVGFHRVETTGNQINTTYKCDGVTAVTVQAAALNAALVADTYIKLGMWYQRREDMTLGTKFLLTFFANGRALTTTKQVPSAAGTDFPNDIALGLVFAVLNATGTTPGTSTIDWWRAAQLYQPING